MLLETLKETWNFAIELAKFFSLIVVLGFFCIHLFGNLQLWWLGLIVWASADIWRNGWSLGDKIHHENHNGSDL